MSESAESDSVEPRDDRPRPRYGEYAPQPVPPQAPSRAATPIIPDPATPARARRSWDVVLTTGLLLIGVYDVVSQFSQLSSLGQALSAVLTRQGVGSLASVGLADQFGAALNVTRIVVLAVSVVVSLLLIARHRLAFWVPLAGGLFSTIAVIVCIIVLLLGDPSFLQYVTDHASTP